MKIFTKVFFVFMILGLALAGCKKEESGNYLQVGDTTIVLSDGNLKYYGSYSATTYNFDIDLVSPQITLTDDAGEPIYTGTGTRIYFETYTTSTTSPENGSYLYDVSGNYLDKTFDYCYYSFGYNAKSFATVYIENGTLDIKNTTSGYEINFRGTDENGLKVKVHYAGTLTYYNRTTAKK